MCVFEHELSELDRLKERGKLLNIDVYVAHDIARDLGV